jgi:Fur family peroxide stress response transcriptional regulator
MDNKIKRLKEKGVVLTIQRMAVLEVLQNSSNHPTVEEIHKKLLKKYPTLSLATVYNALEMLKQAGEIQELNIGREKRFDPSIEPHHHFYCRACERIIDLEIACPIAQKGCINGHKIESVQAIFFGICADCREKGKDNA